MDMVEVSDTDIEVMVDIALIHALDSLGFLDGGGLIQITSTTGRTNQH